MIRIGNFGSGNFGIVVRHSNHSARSPPQLGYISSTVIFLEAVGVEGGIALLTLVDCLHLLLPL
jgi:hypothetical protein